MARLAVVLALLLAAAGCSGERASAPDATEATSSVTEAADATAPRPAVLGLLWEGQRAQLARMNPVTLRPIGRRVEVADGVIHAISPDGETAALTSTVVTGPGGTSDRAELLLVDLSAMRPAGKELELPEAGWVGETIWEQPGRLVLLLGGEPPHVVTVDPHGPRVLRSQPLTGRLVVTDAKAGRLVALLAPASRIGSLRLVVVEASGAARTVALPGVVGGWEPLDHPEDAYATRQRIPGLAVSPDGERAVVVPAGGRVAEIELDWLRVSYHDLSEPVSLLGRLRNWLEPGAQAKVTEGPDRYARWLGNHHVAVTGMDNHGLSEGEVDASPAGLRLIDTRDWSVRTLADEATGIIVVRDLLLAFGGPYAADAGGEGIGLRAFGADGKERFHVLGSELVGWVDLAWPYGYVPHANDETKVDVLDLRTGRLVTTASTDGYVSVVGDGSP
jgi:hypothetical protein